MAYEFTATEEGGVFKVKAIPERKQDGSLVMHIPTIPLIKKLVNKAKKDKKIKELEKEIEKIK